MYQILSLPLLVLVACVNVQKASSNPSSRLQGDNVAEPLFYFTPMQQPMTLPPGGKGVVRCEVTGSPVPIIKWYHNGQPIQNGNEQEVPLLAERLSNQGENIMQVVVTASKINIPCASSESAGEYKCVATNGDKVVEHKTQVFVDSSAASPADGSWCAQKRFGRMRGTPAEVYMWTDMRLEKPGVSAQLMCRATGHPAPSITWYVRNGTSMTAISPQNGNLQVMPNGDLFIKTVPEPTKEGADHDFKCEAKNSLGSDTVTISLVTISPETGDENEKQPENVLDLTDLDLTQDEDN